MKNIIFAKYTEASKTSCDSEKNSTMDWILKMQEISRKKIEKKGFY